MQHSNFAMFTSQQSGSAPSHPVDIPPKDAPVSAAVTMPNFASDAHSGTPPEASDSVRSCESVRDLSELLLLNTSKNGDTGSSGVPGANEHAADSRLQRRLDRLGHAPWQNLARVHGAVAPEHRPPLPHQRHTSVHWFRHGMRLHDNPAIVEALRDAREVYFIFIFDGRVALTDTAKWNRMSFLLESLKDLDQSLRMYNGKLYVYHTPSSCVDVLRQKFQDWKVTKLTFQQDPEALWHDRDNAVKQLCAECNVECIECASHTLWDPHRLTEINGGRGRSPPVRFKEFVALCDKAGEPERPISYPTALFEEVIFRSDYDLATAIPESPRFFGIEKEFEEQGDTRTYVGGEKAALALFDVRMNVEKVAIERGVTLPNQKYVNLLRPPLSLSPYLRLGCLSVRKFYWAVHDEFKRTRGELAKAPLTLTSQLLWREYFYLMSANNINYAQSVDNPVCYQIPWDTNHALFERWKFGRTGYPWIDACMRQLRREGWIHQACRYSVASFLSRGDLWLSWDEGLRVFFEWLIDADWSLSAGNWMWVSSSAFEKALDHPITAHPVRYGKTQDPSGDYVRRWVPELRRMIPEYICEPWLCPKSVQVKLGCIIGRDYPEPCVVHSEVFQRNKQRMKDFCRSVLLNKNVLLPVCGPSDTDEVAVYARLFGKERTALLSSANAEAEEVPVEPEPQHTSEPTPATNADDINMPATDEQPQQSQPPASAIAGNAADNSAYITALGQQLYLIRSADGQELVIRATGFDNTGAITSAEPVGIANPAGFPLVRMEQLANAATMASSNFGSTNFTSIPAAAPLEMLSSSAAQQVPASSFTSATFQQQHPHLYHPYNRRQ